MGWFSHSKPRDLIADSNVEWEEYQVTETSMPAFGTDELRALERSSGWLCTCHEGWTSQMCPFHAIRIPFPEIQIKRGGIKWPTNP